MLAQTYRARLSVRVPRGAAGDVEGGVRDLLADVDGVEHVDVEDLEGVRPDALDLYVDARATVGFADATDAPEARLQDGFGVLEATVE
ncbi:hypothetical protein HWV23_04390 [Natronomonas halophila]|uniref:hypothetical protein n=1 Tax=Natronomonas halophila TaxID=2747817 RepID=UPI0015B5E709|nr:hypothetical protein [Natronomonas halophila]QLD84988.1 hypothetical protein HWV23_04390 [Natronomonas halophila]